MPNRAYLHQLVESIPEELLESAQRALEYQAIVPSPVGRLPQTTVEAIQRRLREQIVQPDDWETLRRKMREGRERTEHHFRQLRERDHRVLNLPQTSGIETVNALEQNGAHSSVQGFDKDGALLVLTFRYLERQKLESAGTSICFGS